VGKSAIFTRKERETPVRKKDKRVKKMARNNSLAAFDSDIENWDTYIDRVKIYCRANEIDDNKKAITLLNVMGAKTLGL